MVLFFLISGCVKHTGTYNKDDSSFFTSSFETETGGSLSNHILFGENSIKLINRAKLRCKKISLNSKIKNLRRTFVGNIITDQMSIYEYDCKED
tara:strand:- start:1455 stop:1736 length:282 start_codon:yes stop_codon:yes gene_type:complete